MSRVLIVNSADVIRKTTDALAHGLAERGYEVRVVTPAHPKTDAYFDGDDRIDLVPYESWFVPKIRYSVPLFDFADVMRREAAAADVVVVTSAVYLPSLVGTLVADWYRTPTVVTIDALVGINWSYGSRVVDLLGKGFVLTLSRVAFRSADAVVGLTGALREHLPALVDESKVHIIPNGIDTEQFTPPGDRQDRSTSPVELLFVGRLSPVKGLEYLLSAFADLQSGPLDVHLTIVGDGENQDEYLDRAERLGIEDAVTWTGWVDDVTQYYERADVLVLPSISEGQPSVLLEAQACGVPVVATDVGGVPELVEAGHVVPPRDPDALRRAVSDLVDTDSGGLAARSRAHVVDNFSEESMVENYLDLFSELSDRQST